MKLSEQQDEFGFTNVSQSTADVSLSD